MKRLTSAIDALRPYAKAVVAFVAPGIVVIGQAVTVSSPGGTHVTGAEWVAALVACFVTSGVVYAVPNRAAAVPPVTPDRLRSALPSDVYRDGRGDEDYAP